MCPTLADDSDGNGVLTNEEATGEYGTIFLSLTTEGDASPDSSLVIDRPPVAGVSGHIDYQRTFSADQVLDELLDHLSQLHIVQHGIDVSGNDRYDLAGLGESTFAKNLGAAGVPEEATDPATCGVVTGAGAPLPPHGGVETSCGSDVNGNLPLALLGGLLIALAATALLRTPPWRRVPSS